MSNSPKNGGVVTFGPFRLSPRERLLTKNGVAVSIGGRALDILIALVERAGQLTSKQELFDLVWPGMAIEEVTLRAHISSLRRILGDTPQGKPYVVNVAIRGYVFAAPVKRSEPNVFRSRISQAGQLPMPRRSLIGRREIVSQLSQQILSDRLVSLVGHGGIGKTAVAVALGHLLFQSFSDGVYFVDLASLDDEADLAGAVAAAVGIYETGLGAEASILAGIADRHVLLVLDNCEHVVGATARICEALIQNAPSAHILATSREALRVNGESVHFLLPLACPSDDVTSAEHALASPAVQLFMDTAKQSGHSPALDDVEAPIVASICRQLDGVALAIELVASRVGTRGIVGTAELLAQDAALEWPGRRNASGRHQTLQAMFDWSWKLLSEEEKGVLSSLSVFVGRFPLAAAHRIAANDHSGYISVMRDINQLVDKSLICVVQDKDRVYYRLLESTRAYASLRLASSGYSDAVFARHAQYFLDRFEDISAIEPNFDGTGAERLAAELGNIRRALGWSFSASGNRKLGVRLAAHASRLFLELSQFDECVALCRKGLSELSEDQRGTELELHLYYSLARAAIYSPVGKTLTQETFEQALHLSQVHKDDRRRLDLLADFSIYLVRTGEFRSALYAALENLKVAKRYERPDEMVTAYWLVGAAYHAGGEHSTALDACRHGFQIFKQTQDVKTDPTTEARARFTLARTLWLVGYPDQALVAAQDTIDSLEHYNRHSAYCMMLLWTAPVFTWSGQVRFAKELVERAVIHADKYALSAFQPIAFAQLGTLKVIDGDVEEGCKLLTTSLHEMLVPPYHIYASPAASDLAKALAAHGQHDRARTTIEAALARAHRSGEQCWLPYLLRMRAEVSLMDREADQTIAERALLSAMECAQKQSALSWELNAATALARLLADQGKPIEAQRTITKIYQRFTEGFQTRDLLAAAQLIKIIGSTEGG